MTEQIHLLESLVTRKDKDISDLLAKINDTIKEYELRLEQKEEQVWAMSEKINKGYRIEGDQYLFIEVSQKKEITVDADLISNIEKKWAGL